MFDSLKSWFGGTKIEAASQLPVIAPPKVKPGVASYPSYLKTTKPTEAFLPKLDRQLANKDITTLRSGSKTKTVIRDLAAASPDLSAAVWAYLRVGIPEGYTAVARNLDNTFNREATLLVQQIMTRFDLLPDYSEGFSGPQSLRSTAESLAKELIFEGACSAELVLDKTRLPRRIQPIAVSQIEFIANKDKTLSPVQLIGSEKVNLDIPTFVYITLDQDLLQAHASSPLESAIKPVLFSEDFAQDIHRIIKRVIHPRQKIAIDEEKVRKYLSVEAQNDPDKAVAELNSIVSSIEQKINGMKPEEALVYLDSLDFSVENPSNAGLSSEYEVLQNIGNARMATGSKTMGTVLGHASSSSNIASTESMLFMKSANGAVRLKLNEVFSRLLTVAVRLFGMDVTVQFAFDDIDLRPAAELEAFKQTKQSRILEQLSLGLISDEEASLQLTGNLPPAGAPKLSGTMFKTGGINGSMGPTVPGEGASATAPSNNGSTSNQKTASDQPSQGRGGNKKAEVVQMRVTE